MTLTKEQLDLITETLEDTVEYICGEEMLAGETVYKVMECLAVAKQAEFQGLVTMD